MDKLQRTLQMLSPPQRNLATALQVLAVSLNSGIGLAKGFELAASTIEADDRKLAKKLLGVKDKVLTGNSVGTAMGGFSDLFPKGYTQAIRIGETTGRLAETLALLGKVEQRRYEIGQKVYNALLYPMLMLSVMVVLNTIVLPYVVLQLVPALGQESDLPWLTKGLLSVSRMMFSWQFWLLLLGLVPLAVYITNDPFVKRVLAKILEYFPALRHGLRAHAYYNLFSSLHVCLAAGISIHSALDSSAAACGDPVLTKQLQDRVQQLVGSGTSVAAVFQDFEPVAQHMIGTGEETGKLDDMVRRLASYYSEVLENRIEMLVSLINPVMTAITGFVVGVVILATMLPIGKLTDSFL